MTDINKFTDALTQMMPKVTPSKNGYEIRTKVLEMAKDHTWQDYHYKLGEYETTVTKDSKNDEVITTVKLPDIPGADAVLEVANKFYEFVNNTKS